MRGIVDKINNSVWCNLIMLVSAPITIIGLLNSPYRNFVYWLLATVVYIGIISDFLKAVASKLENKLKELKIEVKV